MANPEWRDGIVYTETVVFAPPEQYAADAPYQLAIIDVDEGGRTTVRIIANESGERARIGDRVQFVHERDGVAYYRKAGTDPLDTSGDSRLLV
jgi:uncharacterized OB-fold protein